MTDHSPLVLGLDCSTSACKAILWDEHGQAVATGSQALSLSTPRAGWHEQNADDWWQATVLAIRQAVAQVDARRVSALAIAHQRETFVPLDENHQPLCSAILWMDERAGDQLGHLEKAFGREEFHLLTGKRLSMNLTLVKIAWLKEHQSQLFAKTKTYADVHAYLMHKLTGSFVTGWGCADPTGMFDLQTRDWCAPLLEEVGIRCEQLPTLAAPGTIIGRVSASTAQTCGLPKGLPVAAGIGDGQASSLGVNITAPGEASLSLGTSVISGTAIDHYVYSPAFRTMTGGIQGSYLLETVLLGGTYTLTWFLEKMAAQPGKSNAEVRAYYEQAAAQIPAGSQGLVVLPYWNSVLGPYWDPATSGVILGWRGIHQLAHLYRAILEGIAFEQHLGTLGVEEALGQPVKRYIAMGGGANSSLWRQIIADVTGKPVFRAETSEATALGAGILAASAAGLFATTQEAAQSMSRIHPQPEEPRADQHAIYQRFFEEVYRPIYPALKQSLNRLSDLADRQD